MRSLKASNPVNTTDLGALRKEKVLMGVQEEHTSYVFITIKRESARWVLQCWGKLNHRWENTPSGSQGEITRTQTNVKALQVEE